jgi:1,4-dihydroxy-2-naphthoyl-CoA hydrolase
MIWFNDTKPVADAFNAMNAGTINATLGIEVTEVGDDYLRGTMPVDQRTHQPYGILHGGASVVLAESLGSAGAALCVDSGRYRVVGLDINANHLRAVSGGHVTGTATPIHLGRTTQVWSIELRDDDGRMTCICRLTIAVLDTQAGRP